MRTSLILPLVVILVFSATLGFAQGGAAGYGQGGQGGGMGGRGGGGFGGGGANSPNRPQKDDKAARPDEDDTPNLWTSKTAILTPGDRVEFKFKMKKGETLLASATSDAFDPALSIEDSNKKELKRNDDRAEGDQAPFLIYRVSEEATYTLKVLSYRSVSGGKFTVKMRTFVASDAALGAVTHENVAAIPTDYTPHVVFRIKAAKDRIYDLRSVVGYVKNNAYSTLALLRLIGPAGVEASDFLWIPTPDSSPVFLALADGDFYIEYTSNGVTKFKTEYREVAVVKADPQKDQILDLDQGELKVVEFEVKPNLIIHTSLVAPSVAYTLSSASGGTADEYGGDDTYGNNANWLWFRLNRDSDAEVVRVFHGTGTARIAIRSRAPAAQKVTFRNSESVPAWTPGELLKDTLAIGDSRLFLLKSTKSELMRVYAAAKTFQLRLDIFRLAGEVANSLGNRKTHVAGDDLYFPEADTFLVRLYCEGHGGSGAFEMKREELTPTAYTLGTAQALKLDGVNFGLYSVNLEAGKRYQLMTDEPGRTLRADLLDDEGQFLNSQAIGFDKVVVQYFVPARSGRHRLWLRGAPGLRHFKFELHVPPSIGG